MQNDNQPNPNQQPQNNQGAPAGPPPGQQPYPPQQQGMASPPPQPGQPQQPIQPNQPAYSPTPNRPQKKSKAGLIFVILIVLILALGAVLYFYLESQNNEEPVPVEENTEQIQEPQEEEADVDEDVRLDAQRSLAAVGAYQVENEGQLPDPNNDTELAGLNEVLLDTFISPLTSSPYVFVNQEPQEGELQLEINILCSGGVSDGEFLVRTALSDGSIYCADTQNL